MDWSNFVEGYLTGIAVSDGKKIVDISLRDASGQSFILRLVDVDRFVTYEMREKNIIDRINLWGQHSEEKDFREVLSSLVSGKMDGTFEKEFLPLIDHEVESIRRGEKLLLEIEPVFGAYVIALAHNVSVSPLPDA